MKLDHINLTVQNVTQAATFLKKHFGFRDMFDDNNANITALTDGSQIHLLLMKGKNANYPDLFHIGFDLETQDNVDAMYKRLKADGLQVEPPENSWGSWTFSFQCPGGTFLLEVACTAQN